MHYSSSTKVTAQREQMIPLWLVLPHWWPGPNGAVTVHFSRCKFWDGSWRLSVQQQEGPSDVLRWRPMHHHFPPSAPAPVSQEVAPSAHNPQQQSSSSLRSLASLVWGVFHFNLVKGPVQSLHRSALRRPHLHLLCCSSSVLETARQSAGALTPVTATVWSWSTQKKSSLPASQTHQHVLLSNRQKIKTNKRASAMGNVYAPTSAPINTLRHYCTARFIRKRTMLGFERTDGWGNLPERRRCAQSLGTESFPLTCRHLAPANVTCDLSWTASWGCLQVTLTSSG